MEQINYNSEIFPEEELASLRLDENDNNIALVQKLAKVPQIPRDYLYAYNFVDDDDALLAWMEKMDIKKFVHTEGPTVWDHTKRGVRLVNAMFSVSPGLDYVRKQVAAVLFHHDLGKIEVWRNMNNFLATKEMLISRKKLLQSMLGHAYARLDDVRDGLVANGLEGRALSLAVATIRHHTSLDALRNISERTHEMFSDFGETPDEIRDGVRFFIRILQIDGAAKKIAWIDEKGELRRGFFANKTKLNFKKIWGKYEAWCRDNL